LDKLIISAALTGSWPTREKTPYLPITPEEIAQSAVECWREGAAIAHLHMRNVHGGVSCDLSRYAKTVQLVRDAGCDIVLNLSTSGGAGSTNEDERLAIVSLRPEVASLDAGTMNFNGKIFYNSPSFLEKLAGLMLEQGVKSEIECFDTAMIYNALALAEAGLTKPPFWFQFVLGVKGGAPATAKQLLHMVESLPAGSPWSVCAVGRDQLPMNALAIVLGGHARTGIEDNIYYAKGQLAQSNAQLVARLARLAREYGRDLATPAEARRIIGLTSAGADKGSA
jgi:3-keto-5-aminohexanoate cleavage enzyme